MPLAQGLVGLRPIPEMAARLAAPPYDVIRPGSPLERHLAAIPQSIYHISLGADPVGALARMQTEGWVRPDDEPCLYVYEQTWQDARRVGVLTAIESRPYAEGRIRRHEKTFDDKVQGRMRLAKALGLTIGPVFLLTKSPLTPLLERIIARGAPVYHFTSDFGGNGDLHGLANRVFRIPEASAEGRAIRDLIGDGPLYIADGHHRYHAALLAGQTHCLAYTTDGATIRAYNRLVTGRVPFAKLLGSLPLEACPAFATPPKQHFCLYHQGRAYLLAAHTVPNDVVGGLDCSILERELYPRLGLDHSMIMDANHFDYLPETELPAMRQAVDARKYDLAIALHPVAIDQLMAVADAGLHDPEIVMPEKSTYFAPKILTGLLLYRHRMRSPAP